MLRPHLLLLSLLLPLLLLLLPPTLGDNHTSEEERQAAAARAAQAIRATERVRGRGSETGGGKLKWVLHYERNGLGLLEVKEGVEENDEWDVGILR